MSDFENKVALITGTTGIALPQRGAWRRAAPRLSLAA